MGLFNVKFYIIRIRVVYKNLIFMVASFFIYFAGLHGSMASWEERWTNGQIQSEK